MTTPTFINRPCQLVKRLDSESPDAYGNLVPAESSTSTACEVQPRSAVEPGNQGELSDEDWVGFFLPEDEANMNSASKVTVTGFGSFEIVGKPQPWRNPRTQSTDYVQANLRRTTGPEDV